MRLKFYILICIMIIAPAVSCTGTVLMVDKSGKYAIIQNAIDASKDFDTILVKKGTYIEHSIVVNKALVILGEHKPRIEPGGEKSDIFIVTSDNVVIEGFVLAQAEVSFLKEFAAVRVQRCSNGIIRNNEIIGCFFGIYIEYGEDYILENNQVIGASKDEASAGNAIHIWKGKHITVSNNMVTGHRDGIYFEFVDSSKIYGNKSYDNLRYGLHFMFSNDDRYLSNEFKGNGAGVAVMFSKKISMKQNLFSENWGNSSYGLLLKEISDGDITENKFEHNTTAIMAEGVNRIIIRQNQFTQNGTALDIKGNCLDNHIELNNFLRNTFDVMTNSKYNRNTYDKNYWSDYDGYDLNRDGIGDIPYRPVNLFAFITDRIPSAAVMMHSAVVDIMRIAEHSFPEIIPEELIDSHPKMRPYDL